MAQQTNDAPGLAGTEPTYRHPDADNDSIRERIEEQGRYGIMYAGDYAWENGRCTREAYGDAEQNYGTFRRRSLAFHTPWMGVNDAVACIEEIPNYNRFRPTATQAVLEAIDCSLNEGTRVAVGREGSPVLYVWTKHPKTVFAAFLTMAAAERVTDGDPEVHAPDELGGVQGVDAATYPLQVVGSNSAGLDAGRETLLRAWWD
jgi:hypothetical protein